MDLKECQVKGEGRNGAFVLASLWLVSKIIWIAPAGVSEVIDDNQL
ncbi:MAG TPA: hypothetical protein VEF04_10000 [Blastocatellia bacterium]|nr:hypothetical protein [Blastocatellia bacterium]